MTSRICLATTVLTVAAACAPGSADSRTPGPGPASSPEDAGVPGPGATPPAPSPPPRPMDACAGRPATRIEGVVRFPNGTLPVSRALVYVPVDPSGAVPRSGTCGECIDRTGVWAVVETEVDGRFVLSDVPPDATMVVVQKGPFVRRVPVTLAPCADNELPAEATRLPRDSSEGEVPRIAVVTGTFDHMQTVLTRLGLSSSAIEIVAGDPDDPAPNDGGAGLFRDRDRLLAFDYVFVNCGAGLADSWAAASPLTERAMRDNIVAFVEGGGRLYVTDLAYDVLEVAMPSAIDFGGSAGTSETPEPIDGAESGPSIDRAVHAEVLDADLRAWLGETGALDAAGQMEVRGLEDGWVRVSRANPDRAVVWVRGPLDADVVDDPWGDPWDEPTSVEPSALTVTSDRGCGRALFTSYHTLHDGGGATLSAQEQALAYLVLEIGNCIEEPQLR